MQKIKELVTKAELLLLNKPTVAITEAAHFANTLLSESADSKDGQTIGVVGADSSETEIVKQNEQTKEVYPHPMDEACNECDTIPDEDGRCLCWGG